MSGTVLFLCTGNFYRSRFAEYYFNARAETAELPWRADSRGLATERNADNVGPISPYALNGLREHNIPLPDAPRPPQQVEEADLRAARLIIALKEAEHRPLLAERCPAWVDRVTYWHIHDLDQAPATQALGEIASGIDQLIHSLLIR